MSLARSTLVVGLATAASRLLGFARDVLIAGALGAGPVADAFLVAFRLPNLARRVLSEGGLNAGFVPLYARIRAARGADAAGRFAGEALSGLAVVLIALVGIVEIAAGPVVLALAAGYAEEGGTLALAVLYTRLAFPFVAGVTLASLLAALLNAERRFAAAALAPVVVNLVLIAALLGLRGRPALPMEGVAAWLSLAVAASGFVHLAIVALALARSGLGVPLGRPRLSADMRRLLAAGSAGLAASGAAQLVILAGTQVASFTPSAVSWLYYADRVFQLPLGFVGSALGLVILSEVATRHAAGDAPGVAAMQNRALEGALLLALPAAAALLLLAGPIARTLFERGAFTPSDSEGVAAALAGMSPGLPLAVIGKVLSQTVFARGDVRAALVAALAGVLVTIAGALALAGQFGVLGIGLGISLGFTAHAAMLAAPLRRAGLWRADPRLTDRAWRIGAATAAMVLALVAGRLAVEAGLGPGPPAQLDALVLSLLCLGGLAVYAGAALAFGAVTRADWHALRGRP